MAQRIWLVRHGQTDYNRDGRWQGQMDIPLNEQGRREAAALRDYLIAHHKAGFRRIISSDLMRALDTARAVATAYGLKPETDVRWREIHLGTFEGLMSEDIQQRYPDEWATRKADPANYIYPNGENRAMLRDRALEAFHAATDDRADGDVAVFAHGGTIRVLLAHLFDGDERVAGLKVPNTSFSRLRRDGDGWIIEELSATPHLG